jgi:hypothetical protein
LFWRRIPLQFKTKNGQVYVGSTMETDKRKLPRHIRRLLIISSIYILSFSLPVFTRNSVPLYNTAGVIILIDLVLMPMHPVGIPALMINFFFCFAVFLAYRRLRAAATGFGVLALIGSGVLIPYLREPANADPELSLGPGYYTWVLSMVLVVISSLFQPRFLPSGDRSGPEKPPLDL